MRGQLARYALYGLSAIAAVAAVFVALALLSSATSPATPQPSAQTAQVQAPASSEAADGPYGSAGGASDAQAGSGASSIARSGDDAQQGGAEHVHTWETAETVRHVPEESHVETVEVEGADIVEYHTECDACGEICDGEDALAAHYQLHPTHAHAGYTTGVPVVVGKGASSTEQRTVVDREAHDEIVVTRKCSSCGAVEEVPSP